MPPPTLTRRAALAGAAALGLVRPSRAAEAPGAELIVSAYGLPYVPAAIEGRPVLASLDTGGARGVQLSETLATALGLALAPTGQTTRRLDGSMRPVAAGTVSAFEIAGARFAPQAVAVAGNDIETIARQVGVAFDAILGWAFLGARPFVIDYPGRRFALGAASAPSPELTLKLVEAPRAPVTEGAVAGATVRSSSTPARRCPTLPEAPLSTASSLGRRRWPDAASTLRSACATSRQSARGSAPRR